MNDVSAGLMELHSFSRADARNAYSARLLFPGFQSLRFNNMISVIRKNWKCDTPKYAAFWSPEPIIRQLLGAAPSVRNLSTPALRLHLLLSLRLFHLCRGVDLSTILRVISFVGNRPFMKIKRKGWSAHRWEEVIGFPHSRLISPWHLMQEYVARTHTTTPPGGPLFLSLQPPFKALTANTLNGLTKTALVKFGIPPNGGHTVPGVQAYGC